MAMTRSRTRRQQRPRQPARTGPDLDDGLPVEWPGFARDARGEIKIEQEILAQRPPRFEPVASHDIAQGAEAYRS